MYNFRMQIFFIGSLFLRSKVCWIAIHFLRFLTIHFWMAASTKLSEWHWLIKIIHRQLSCFEMSFVLGLRGNETQSCPQALHSQLEANCPTSSKQREEYTSWWMHRELGAREGEPASLGTSGMAFRRKRSPSWVEIRQADKAVSRWGRKDVWAREDRACQGTGWSAVWADFCVLFRASGKKDGGWEDPTQEVWGIYSPLQRHQWIKITSHQLQNVIPAVRRGWTGRK